MSIPLSIAVLLCGGAFFIHTFAGDKELQQIKPDSKDVIAERTWIMSRCGWHWISLDLLLATTALVYFGWLQDDFQVSARTFLFYGLTVYFGGYAIVWLFTIVISPATPKRYLVLGQWMLLLAISLAIFLAV